MREPGRILVVSCYELGHQPVSVASAVAFLERDGYRPSAVDIAVERLPEFSEDGAPRLVAISVPMHTALHAGVRVAIKIRECVPSAHLCFFGHYAVLNGPYLLDGFADSVIGGECESTLVELARALEAERALGDVEGLGLPRRPARPVMARLDFPQPSRSALPGLEQYARLESGTDKRLAAAVEASRGCLHRCRHCPIVPIYGGRFFVVPREIVLSDVAALIDAGATHLTFADPDFLNGPRHSMSIVRAIHDRFPRITFDVTTKIEMILKHRGLLEELAACGCLFVVSAVESLCQTVLEHLQKGHTRDDVDLALRLLRSAGLTLRPSLLPFTPWAGLDDYVELLDWIDHEALVRHVDPVQLSVRLLLPPGSPLIDLPAMRPHLETMDPARFSHGWKHPDPRMDRLHAEVTELVRGAAVAGEDDAVTFEKIRLHAERTRGDDPAPRIRVHPAARDSSRPPRLTEPWFC